MADQCSRCGGDLPAAIDSDELEELDEHLTDGGECPGHLADVPGRACCGAWTADAYEDAEEGTPCDVCSSTDTCCDDGPGGDWSRCKAHCDRDHTPQPEGRVYYPQG